MLSRCRRHISKRRKLNRTPQAALVGPGLSPSSLCPQGFFTSLSTAISREYSFTFSYFGDKLARNKWFLALRQTQCQARSPRAAASKTDAMGRITDKAANNAANLLLRMQSTPYRYRVWLYLSAAPRNKLPPPLFGASPEYLQLLCNRTRRAYHNNSENAIVFQTGV